MLRCPRPVRRGTVQRELQFCTLHRSRRSRTRGRAPRVRHSDRGLLAALGALFFLLVGAILVLTPVVESEDPPWIVGDVVPAPQPDAGGADPVPPPFERMQVFEGRTRGLPEGLPAARVAVHGRVRSRDGAFVAGAAIHASAGSREGDEPWVVEIDGVQRSLGDGFFAFEAELATPCLLVVHVQHQDHPPATFVRELPAGVLDQDVGYLVLDAGASAEGRVVDDAGRPVAGARVRMVPLMEPPATLATVSDSFFAVRNVVTDRSGAYRLERIVPGDWMLEVSADEYQVVRTSGFTLLPGPDNALELVVLQRAHGLAVDVVGPDGRAVPDAEVRATEVRSGRVHVAQSSRAGSFVFSQLPDAVLDVEATSPRLRRTVLRGIEGGAAGSLRIQLARGLVVSGRATDTSGRPVERFSVAVVPDDGTGAGAEWVEREARTQRRVVLQRMRELAATVDGRTEVRRLLQQEDAKLVEAAARREALLGSTADARALAAVAFGEPPPHTFLPGGAYEVGGLDDLRVQVVFHAPGFAPLWSEPFDLAGQDMIVDVEFGAGHVLRGFVRDGSGLPVAGACVRAIPRDRGFESAMRMVAAGIGSATSAADGSFALRGIPDGNWALLASADACVPAVSENLAVEGDRDGIVLWLRRKGALEGRVAGAPHGGPVEVVAVPVGAGLEASPPVRVLASVGGSYRMDGLEPGQHVVRALHVTSGRRTKELVDQMRSGAAAPDAFVVEGETARLDLGAPELPGAAVSGTVYDAGRPGRGLVVAVRMVGPMDGEPAAQRIVAETALDPEGRFRLTDLPDGACELVVQLPRDRQAVLASRSLTLASGTEQQVAFEVATCQLHGMVMLPHGVDSSGLRARLVRAGGAEQHEVIMTSGAFRFDRVAAGEWQLLVDKPGLRHAMPVRLESGFRNEVVVDATSAGTRLRERSPR